MPQPVLSDGLSREFGGGGDDVCLAAARVSRSPGPVLDHYEYLAVGGFVLLEDFGVPVPGETILIAAAVYAGAGRLSVVGVGLIAFLAAVIGDNLGYAIGHFGGRALVLRYGRYVMLTSERLDKAEGFFCRHGGKVVVAARFIEGLRQANGIVAGTARMPWRQFLSGPHSTAIYPGQALSRGLQQSEHPLQALRSGLVP